MRTLIFAIHLTALFVVSEELYYKRHTRKENKTKPEGEKANQWALAAIRYSFLTLLLSQEGKPIAFPFNVPIRYQSLLAVIIYSEYSAQFLRLEKKLAWVNRVKSQVANSFNDDIEKEDSLKQSRHSLLLKEEKRIRDIYRVVRMAL